MSDSVDDSDYTDNEDISNSKVNSIVEKCLQMKPKYNISKKSKHKSYIDLKKRLDTGAKIEVKRNDKKSSTRSSDRKNIDNCFRELTEDFSTIFDKLRTVYECVTEMLDKMEDIENRVSELEKKQSEKPPPPPIQTFSEALRSQTDNRINKLEYSASEQERNNRVASHNNSSKN